MTNKKILLLLSLSLASATCATAQHEVMDTAWGMCPRLELAPLCWDKSYWGLKGHVKAVSYEHPGLMDPISLAFDSNGRLTSENGFECAYDEQGRIKSMKKQYTAQIYDNGATRNESRLDVYAFVYDEESGRCTARGEMMYSQENGEWKRDDNLTWIYLYTYDEQGQLASIRDNNSDAPAYHYKNGRASEWAGKTNEWDTQGRIVKCVGEDEDPEEGDFYEVTTTFTYDANGRLTKKTRKNQVCDPDTRKPAGRASSSVNTYRYTVDAQGNWTRMVELQNGRSTGWEVKRTITYY